MTNCTLQDKSYLPLDWKQLSNTH
uniref:Uncharacterized protein n=1 Tax=Anguilla anguilla TaxID=7936 RepID=A0A0E9Q499_ANGAN